MQDSGATGQRGREAVSGAAVAEIFDLPSPSGLPLHPASIADVFSAAWTCRDAAGGRRKVYDSSGDVDANLTGSVAVGAAWVCSLTPCSKIIMTP